MRKVKSKDRVMNAVGPKVRANGEKLQQKATDLKTDIEEIQAELASVAVKESEALATIKAPGGHSLKALTFAHAQATAATEKQDQLSSDLKLLQERLGYAQNGYSRWYQSLDSILGLRHKIAQEQSYYAAYEAWCNDILAGKKDSIKPRMGPITRSLQDQRWLESQEAAQVEGEVT